MQKTRKYRQHVVSLALAIVLENALDEIVDLQKDYRGTRINALRPIAGRVHSCTDTIRDETYRIISVRKASCQEQRLWLS